LLRKEIFLLRKNEKEIFLLRKEREGDILVEEGGE